MTAPTFSEAKAFVIPWGLFRTKTIDFAATSGRGLRWLDWMRGELDAQGVQRYAPDVEAFRLALGVYLDDETIAADVAKLVRA